MCKNAYFLRFDDVRDDENVPDPELNAKEFNEWVISHPKTEIRLIEDGYALCGFAVIVGEENIDAN